LIQKTQSDAESDAALLARFARLRDEAAFTELMRRHGPMVLGVSSRMLRQPQDAEDALQAVFLTLSARARSLRRVRSVAGWLHSVAVRISLNLLKMKRRREEGLRRLQQDGSEPDADEAHELKELLDAELAQLPARFKEIVILRDLEGYSRSEVAKKLGVPSGTVDSRLSRGRKLLRDRLVRRGVTIAGGGVAAALAHYAEAGHKLPAILIQEAFRNAELFSVGTNISGVAAVAKITSLAQKELNTMFLTKLSKSICLIALTAAIWFGTSPISKVVGFVSKVGASTVVFDDFNDGSATDASPATWRPYVELGLASGTFVASTGDFVLTPQSGANVLAAVLEPAVDLTDLSIRTQLRNTGTLDTTTQGTGFLVRANFAVPNQQAYDCGIENNGKLYIATNQGGFTELAAAQSVLRPLEEDVILQLDVIGTSLKLFAWRAGEPKPQQPQVQATSSYRMSGSIGIYHNPPAGNGSATFRYINISTTSIPEPSSLALASLSTVALAILTLRVRLLPI
jgi:RNA polymerase sigma factor (sigma-70 family)